MGSEDQYLGSAVDAVRDAVAALEASLEEASGTLHGTQRDMFGGPATPVDGAGSAPASGRAQTLASIDRAIAGLEEILANPGGKSASGGGR